MKPDESLPDRLRRTTEAMANTPAYVGMELWNDHSNAALDAANEIECLKNEISEACQRAAAIDCELNALRVKMDSLCCHLNPRKEAV